MEKFDVNLFQYMKTWKTMTLLQISGIIINLVHAMEIIHECAYFYNDFRLENIMLRVKKEKIKV